MIKLELNLGQLSSKVLTPVHLTPHASHTESFNVALCASEPCDILGP